MTDTMNADVTCQGHAIRRNAILTETPEGFRFSISRTFWEDDFDYDMDGNRFDDGNSGYYTEPLFESLPFTDFFDAEAALAATFPFMAHAGVNRPRRSNKTIHIYREVQ